jgi:hypothetical protein
MKKALDWWVPVESNACLLLVRLEQLDIQNQTGRCETRSSGVECLRPPVDHAYIV